MVKSDWVDVGLVSFPVAEGEALERTESLNEEVNEIEAEGKPLERTELLGSEFDALRMEFEGLLLGTMEPSVGFIDGVDVAEVGVEMVIFPEDGNDVFDCWTSQVEVGVCVTAEADALGIEVEVPIFAIGTVDEIDCRVRESDVSAHVVDGVDASMRPLELTLPVDEASVSELGVGLRLILDDELDTWGVTVELVPFLSVWADACEVRCALVAVINTNVMM